MKESFIIIGGDKRQEYLKNILDKKFDSVFHIANPADLSELANIGKYTHIILPVPVSKDKNFIFSSNNDLKIKLKDIFDLLSPHQKVYGSGFENIKGAEFEIADMMSDKAFKFANACLTAQGALRLMLENTEDYIIGKKVLILGFGDVASTLADILSKLGLDIYIAARNNSQLSTASLRGYKTLKLTSVGNCIYIFDYIFGTVPSNILSMDDIKSMNNNSTYFELASKSFSANKDYFKEYDKRYIWGGSLPGRFLPEASAKLIADFILMNL